MHFHQSVNISFCSTAFPIVLCSQSDNEQTAVALFLLLLNFLIFDNSSQFLMCLLFLSSASICTSSKKRVAECSINCNKPLLARKLPRSNPCRPPDVHAIAPPLFLPLHTHLKVPLCGPTASCSSQVCSEGGGPIWGQSLLMDHFCKSSSNWPGKSPVTSLHICESDMQ